MAIYVMQGPLDFFQIFANVHNAQILQRRHQFVDRHGKLLILLLEKIIIIRVDKLEAKNRVSSLRREHATEKTRRGNDT